MRTTRASVGKCATGMNVLRRMCHMDADMDMWTDNGNNKYSTFASDARTLMTKCPQCTRTTMALGFTTHRDNENDITHWTYACACGAVLTVFND